MVPPERRRQTRWGGGFRSQNLPLRITVRIYPRYTAPWSPPPTPAVSQQTMVLSSSHASPPGRQTQQRSTAQARSASRRAAAPLCDPPAATTDRNNVDGMSMEDAHNLFDATPTYVLRRCMCSVLAPVHKLELCLFRHIKDLDRSRA